MTSFAASSRIITGPEAVALFASGRHVVFLDVRSAPGKDDLRAEYETAHIPGAHFADLPGQLAGKGGGVHGNRPLPSTEQLQRDIARWGITPESVVIVYSKATHAAAARAWFVLKWAGVPEVRYLDGGIDAWQAAGGSVSSDAPVEGGGTFVVGQTGLLPTLSADDIADYVSSGRAVLDARDGGNYVGDGSPRSGHIPGAASLPSKQLTGEGGRLLPREDLLALLGKYGVASGDTVGVYCGGGVAASLSALALQEHGIDARLYVGSFSAWAADPERPVEQGQPQS